MMLMTAAPMFLVVTRAVDNENVREIPILKTYIKLAVYVYLHLLILYITVIVCMGLRPLVMGMRMARVRVLWIHLKRVSRRLGSLRLLLVQPADGRSPRHIAGLARQHGKAASGIWSASPPTPWRRG